MKVSITSRHEQATLANVNRIGIVGMLCADDLVSLVSRRTSPSCRSYCQCIFAFGAIKQAHRFAICVAAVTRNEFAACERLYYSSIPASGTSIFESAAQMKKLIFDFRTAIGGVASRIAGRYVTERSSVGR
jgi:hypothetical protein